jgi:uncharacterized membrane protein YgdD (TMEM256/DUF423 family)
MRALTAVAGLFGLVLVIAGAAGAHQLAAGTADATIRSNWDSAMLYGFVHVLAALACVALPFGRLWRTVAGWLFLAGVLLFSFSILARWSVYLSGSEFQLNAIGMLAPVGGISFMLGWVALMLSAILAGKQTVFIGEKAP